MGINIQAFLGIEYICYIGSRYSIPGDGSLTLQKPLLKDITIILLVFRVLL